MNKSLVSIALLLAMLAPFGAFADGEKKDCNVIKNTDCDLVLHGVKRKIIPVDDLVCIYFVQPRQSNVLLTIIPTDKRRPPRQYTKNAGTHGQFCVGSSWVKQAQAMCMCNVKDGNAVFTSTDTAAVAGKPKNARMPGEACLYGDKECRAKSYKTQNSLPADVQARLRTQCEDAFKKWRASHR